jgi:hypothetical protein
MSTRLALVVLILASGVGWCTFRPVCMPLSSQDLAGFTSPIETRTDRDFYLRVFQQRDGQWHQCKVWISRKFTF